MTTPNTSPLRQKSAVTANVSAAVLGLAAFSASYVHVVRLAKRSGQTGWVAYAIATSIELMTMAAVTEIRYRTQRGESARWPRCVLVLGTVMSLGANLATAKASPWGYVMAAWPSLAFLAVAGIVETRTTHTDGTGETDDVAARLPYVRTPSGVRSGGSVTRTRSTQPAWASAAADLHGRSGPVDSDVCRAAVRTAAEGGRTDVPVRPQATEPFAASADSADRSGTPSGAKRADGRVPALSSPDRADRPSRKDVVDALIEAMRQDATWRPDYAELTSRTGYSRSWCEKRVAQARRHLSDARRAPYAEAIRTEPPLLAVSARSSETAGAGPNGGS